MMKPKQQTIKLAFIGHPDITPIEAKKIVRKWFDVFSTKYDVSVIATIKDDPIGVTARKLARSLDIDRETADRTTHEHNLLPIELTAATLMWAADRFIIVHSGNKKTYSYAASEICVRMRKKYRVVDENGDKYDVQ
jgi:predicted RNA-binding protein with PUA domain